MAEDERPEPTAPRDEPSLELPSLRSALRQKKTRKNDTRPSASRGVVPRFPQQDEEQPAPEPKRRRERRPRHLTVPGPVAAAFTGGVVGLALVGLTSAALHLCTSWRGTSSCGGPGIVLLLAITVAAAMVGAVLLRLLGVATAASTSLLGVGLLGVLVLLALLPVIDSGWMILVVPALAMLTHLAAWWLTTTYVEPGELRR